MFLGFVLLTLSIWLVCSVLGCVFGVCGAYFAYVWLVCSVLGCVFGVCGAYFASVVGL